MTDTDTWFAALDPAQHEILADLRALILATDDNIEETLKWGQPCYTQNGLFCYLQKAKAHVTIGFQKGAQIVDDANLLEGQGKDMRHLRFSLGSTVPRDDVQRLVNAALALDAENR